MGRYGRGRVRLGPEFLDSQSEVGHLILQRLGPLLESIEGRFEGRGEIGLTLDEFFDGRYECGNVAGYSVGVIHRGRLAETTAHCTAKERDAIDACHR